MKERKKLFNHSETVVTVVLAADVLFFGLWYLMLFGQAVGATQSGRNNAGGSMLSIYMFFICIALSAGYGYFAGKYSRNFMTPCIIHLLIGVVFFIVLQSTDENGVNVFAFILPILFALIFSFVAMFVFNQEKKAIQKVEDKKNNRK
ncbi:MAG TPA: hypothetical protein DCY74_01325 [Clostridiales bacterium]|jgi:hypothetical protein|nr:hypothetical protein [Clostridiales bacterium]HCG34776.1 hypothetical protein [Clostridiales bacterium]